MLLRGPLGAGKTTLVEGFVDAMGAGRASSPTFVLAHSYPAGRMPVWHLDLYRIEDARDIEDLDLSQYVPDDGVALVEWPERAPEMWPADRVEIALQIAGTARTAQVRGFGTGVRVVEALVVPERSNVVPERSNVVPERSSGVVPRS
jgi:tRNA threonylcarbamoyl adenosine modification protein YjeE